MSPPQAVENRLREALYAIYRRLVDRGEVAKFHPGVGRLTIERFTPQMRAALDRRIVASANLIRLNRDEVIEKTLRRFSGWATSVPPGGSRTTNRREVKEDVKKPLASSPFVERRVLIDQGHKLSAAISDVIATENSAIAAKWNSHWREQNYDYRVKHRERDGRVYAIRGNWALERGYMKAGDAGYLDEVTQPGEEPFCRCWVTYVYAVGRLPDDMVTQKGRDELERVRSGRAA